MNAELNPPAQAGQKAGEAGLPELKVKQSQKLSIKDFAQTFYPFAKIAEEKTGISALAILAQAALESGWNAASPRFMFFGIKAKPTDPENKRQLLTTREVSSNPNLKFPEIISITKNGNLYTYKVKDWFRAYDSPAESFADHGNFFLQNHRYAAALTFKSDPYKFIDEIAKAGYATDPNYAKVLKGVVDKIKAFI